MSTTTAAPPPNGQQQKKTARPPTEAERRMGALVGFLEARKSKLAAVLPKTLTPERLLKIAIQACSRNARLLECTLDSIYLAVHQAAQLGLEPGGPLGDGYLVPFRNKRGVYEAQFQLGYRGVVRLARRSGQLLSIEARVVRDGDEFKCEYGLDPVLVHKPNFGAEKLGAPVFFYAIARLRDDAVQYDVMTRAEIDAIRGRSKSKDEGPWVTDYDEMGKKTVIKRLGKLLPLATEEREALERDDEADVVETTLVAVPDLPGADAPLALPDVSKTEQLKAELQQRGRKKDAVPAGGERPVAGTHAMTIEGLDEPPPDDDPAASDPAMAEGVDVGELEEPGAEG